MIRPNPTVLDEIMMPTSNLPLCIKAHMDVEAHPFCQIIIKRHPNGITTATIEESARKFYD